MKILPIPPIEDSDKSRYRLPYKDKSLYFPLARRHERPTEVYGQLPIISYFERRQYNSHYMESIRKYAA
ncbi:MAG: hypothetical protein AABY16_00135 [Nanoarchaeota archaeon]